MITLMTGSRFELQSYASGTTYLLTDVVDLRDVLCQGDAAVALGIQLEAIETMMPNGSPDDILGYLWDQCEYRLAAKEF